MKNLSSKKYLLINILLGLFMISGVFLVLKTAQKKEQETAPYQKLNDDCRFKISQSVYSFQNWLLGGDKINVPDQIFADLSSIHKELRAAIEQRESKYLPNSYYSLNNEELNNKIKRSYNSTSDIIDVIQTKYNYRLVKLKRYRNSSNRIDDERKYMEDFDRISKELFLNFEETDNTISMLDRSNHFYIMILQIILLVILFIALAYFVILAYRQQHKKEKTKAKLAHLVTDENQRTEKLTEFVQSIKSSNFETVLDIDTNKDEFARSVVDLKQKLKESAEEERKQKEENEKRNWITQGVAWASDVLRDNYEGIDDLSYNIISGLVKYLEANQGGLFIINEDNENEVFLELTGAYAYEHRKHLQKHVKIGEGLVGTCFREGKTVYLKEVPENYIKITSGMGDASPRRLIIVPLIFDDKCFGVIEIASFNEIENHQKEFLENVGETIASTISSARINERTAYLLEQSNQQAEEMKAQEEEMRQNMEEMQATQEEASRREAELKSMVSAIDFANIVIEYDLGGNIISANDAFANAINKPINVIIGDNHKNYFPLFIENRDEYLRFWNRILNGEKQKVNTTIMLESGKKIELHEAYSPIFDQNEHVVKIVNYATVIE